MQCRINMDRRNFIDEHEVLFSQIREEKNRHYESARRIRRGGLLAANVLVILFCLSRYDGSVTVVIAAMIVMLIAANLPLLTISNNTLISTSAIRQFNKSCKSGLGGSIIRLISDGLTYKPQNRVSNKLIHQSGLFGVKVTEAKGRNLITGSLGNSEIEMSELQVWSGLKRVFSGFFMSASNVNPDYVDEPILRSLGAEWLVKDMTLYAVFPGVEKLFDIRIEKSDRTIEEARKHTRFLLKLASVIEKAAGHDFISTFRYDHIPVAVEEVLKGYKIHKVPVTGKEFILASNTRRLLTAVIDFFAIQLFSVPAIMILYLAGLRPAEHEMFELMASGVIIAMIFIYYFVCELWFGGTIGKQFTKTRVIMTDGSRPRFKALLKRTLARFIPFEQYSFVNSETGLHDRLSETRVVRTDIER